MKPNIKTFMNENKKKLSTDYTDYSDYKNIENQCKSV
jgi:hypothetical protein